VSDSSALNLSSVPSKHNTNRFGESDLHSTNWFDKSHLHAPLSSGLESIFFLLVGSGCLGIEVENIKTSAVANNVGLSAREFKTRTQGGGC
jgi:hypothetical protein